MDIDKDKIDDAVLALLWLNDRNSGWAWKGFDWAAMERLHQSELITDPRGRAKSVGLTEEGVTKGERLFEELFGRR